MSSSEKLAGYLLQNEHKIIVVLIKKT